MAGQPRTQAQPPTMAKRHALVGRLEPSLSYSSLAGMRIRLRPSADAGACNDNGPFRAASGRAAHVRFPGPLCRNGSFRFRPKTVFAHTRLSFPEADLVEVSPPEPEATEHGGGERSAFARHLTISGRQLNGRLERVKGIEPSSSAWKAVALPLSYTREPASRCRGAISCEPVAPPTSLRTGYLAGNFPKTTSFVVISSAEEA